MTLHSFLSMPLSVAGFRPRIMPLGPSKWRWLPPSDPQRMDRVSDAPAPSSPFRWHSLGPTHPSRLQQRVHHTRGHVLSRYKFRRRWLWGNTAVAARRFQALQKSHNCDRGDFGSNKIIAGATIHFRRNKHVSESILVQTTCFRVDFTTIQELEIDSEACFLRNFTMVRNGEI